MGQLVFTSVMWAFSFSLIGVYLAGKVDSYLAILIRFLLAALVLTPFLKIRKYDKIFLIKIMAIGALQIGMMYLFFYHSFLYLSVPEVILFTITTPLYIEFLGDFKQKKIKPISFLAVICSVAGAAVINYGKVNPNFFFGFFLVQLCNLCFGSGQLLYKYLLENEKKEIRDRDIFALFYYGATLFILPFSFFLSHFDKIPQTREQYLTLLWLGIGASGLGYLLWNSGARKVNHSTLALMNNLVIPLGIMVNFILWNRNISWPSFLIGASLITLPLLNLKITRSRRC